MYGRNRAVWVDDSTIRLVDPLILDSLNRTIIDRRADDARELGILRMRSGVLHWNGNDPNPRAQHRPGEVVS